ncbi:MAG: endosialidase [Lachnospiraceae bacterium]|nr:endosialidase [Lachnospiraceae bacterium]
MSVVKELLRSEENNTISFGNYELRDKKKVEDFSHMGDIYKVKTFEEITKLEKNGMFLYESVPGTAVHEFSETAEGVSFLAEGAHSTQVTVGLKEDTEYEVFLQGNSIGKVKTNLSGKLNLSIDLKAEDVDVKIVEA